MRNRLIAYAMDFASFLMDDAEVSKKVRKIILFGSVAKGVFDKESDVDLFIDMIGNKKTETEIKKNLKMFNLSERRKKWELKGVENPLSLKTGRLEKWRLKRDIIADGILLYGKYEELPKGLKYYVMFRLDFGKRKFSEKMKIWRSLYGYKQKINSKIYTKKSFLEEAGGKKIERSVVIVPAENKKKMIDFLRKNKINYFINEIWSDTL